MDLALDKLPEDLRGPVAALLRSHDEIVEERGQLVAERQRLLSENQILRHLLRLERIGKFGPKSEKLEDLQLELLESEPSVAPEEVENEAEAPKLPEAKKRSEHPGRERLPAHLPRKVETLEVPADRCSCPQCHEPMTVIGYDESEQLDAEPVKYFVRVTRRGKRTCRRCGSGVQAAELPQRILPKSKLSDAFLIEVLIQKYGRHCPLYRQCAALEQDLGLELSPQTLGNGVMAAGRLLEPVVAAMKPELFAQGYIQADETTTPVQTRSKPGKNHIAYFWEYSRPLGPVIFDFQMGRGREGPKAFLKGYRGWLQTDGYGVYDDLGPDIEYAGCLAHARRNFFQAHQLEPKAPGPLAVLKCFAALYGVEEEARSQALGSEARLALRQEKSAPLMKALQATILELKSAVLPKSKLGQACGYAIRQWSRLVKFLEHGVLEADNNWCENAMRPLALGRKNWLHLGSESAGAKVAAIASIFQTCKRNQIPIRDYLMDVLPRLGEWPIKRIGELTPLAWKALRRS